ncbi:SURF1 family protein [Sphingomonas sp. AR_OL41]|uniref:SURF1 family protein n=1 Tax=Sphingomonas sp. AR_OL41 TaxID=3042729 RepID=UPI00248125C2|nr:SURF1 family protein [Sphingomonas sp. AR_OL41]MDH7975392.1 SURF1 family protein [Sphingomonas sp. AR_OL41]
MKRLPVLATIIVGLAIVIMIALGIWQLQRRDEKEALLAQITANRQLAPIAFPAIPIGDTLLFRRASAFCLKPVSWQSRGGRDAAGKPGWREIASCSTGAEGPGVMIQIGVAPTATTRPDWKGGKVSGYISYAPSTAPMIVAAFTHAPRTLMLVADPPQAGLAANPPADLSAVPNNHLAYAVQWFLFAAIAAIIYAIALRRRWRAV